MILTGNEIEKQVGEGKIIISPFNKININPNSYDFSLGDRLKYYKNKVIDPKVKQPVFEIKIPENGFVLKPGRIYLGHTHETMGSNFFVPIIRGRSSTARLGLFVHITADMIDIGSLNQWTLQLFAVQPIKVYPYSKIGQVTFWKPLGDISLYHGKYQGSKGPQESKIYLDF